MITIRRWNDDDLDVAVRSNSPEFMTYLGGPETPEKVRARAAKYADGTRTGANTISVAETDEVGVDGGVVGRPEVVGIVGYWPTEEDGEPVLESGWTIFVPGRGFATAAVAQLLAHAAVNESRRFVHAYPRLEHASSNALCERAGFELLGVRDFEYPPGTLSRNNDWRFDLDRLRSPSAS